MYLAGKFADAGATAFSQAPVRATVLLRPRQRGVKHAVSTARSGSGANAAPAGKDDKDEQAIAFPDTLDTTIARHDGRFGGRSDACGV